MVIMGSLSEIELKKISEIIIGKTYPNPRRYGGCFNAFPVRFDKETNEYFQFNNDANFEILKSQLKNRISS
jgi:hypothetical protein